MSSDSSKTLKPCAMMSTDSSATLKTIALEDLAKEASFSALVDNFKKAGPMQMMKLIWDFDQPKKRLSPTDQKRLDNWLMGTDPNPSWLQNISVQSVKASDFESHVALSLKTLAFLSSSSVCPDCKQAYRIGSKCTETGMYHMS